MRRHRQLIVGLAAAVVAAGALGIGTAVAGGGDDEGSVTGPAADRAVAAALEITGGGRANAVERDSEDGAAWEVEVTKPDGSTVDVRLDDRYGLVVVEGDSEEPDADDGSD
jgi:hypothetical protein